MFPTNAPEATVLVHFTSPGLDGPPEAISRPQGIPMPAWKVRAFAQILAHGAAPIPAARTMGYDYTPDIDGMPRAADKLAAAALKCQQARWNDAAPYRITDNGGIVHYRVENPPQEGVRSLQIQSLYSDLIGAAEAARSEWLASGSVGGAEAVEAMAAHAQHAFYCALGAMNVPPADEAKLAASGYTSTEYALEAAAACIEQITLVWRLIGSERAALSFGAVQRAALIAGAARKTIEEGVQHTLRAHAAV